MAKIYHYPDGSQSFTKPKDGQKFELFSHGKFDSDWMWDGLYERWIRVAGRTNVLSNGQPVVHVGNPTGSDSIDDEIRHLYGDLRSSTAKEKVCECGAEKVKSPIHSNYCPKST